MDHDATVTGGMASPPTQSPTIGKLAEALAKAQGMMSAARKDADNPYFNSRYADLAACWECCREPLAANGLAIIQTTVPTCDGSVRVVSTLAHSSGEWIRGELAMKPVKGDPQGIGSALTYARRYGLCSLVGIVADEDDDGEAAQGRGQPVVKKAEQTQPRQPKPSEQSAASGESQPKHPGKASESQIKAIWAITKGKNMEAHQAASAILGREVDSLNNLTAHEASRIIDGLNKGEGARHGQ